jgi:hypothetical protein
LIDSFLGDWLTRDCRQKKTSMQNNDCGNSFEEYPDKRGGGKNYYRKATGSARATPTRKIRGTGVSGTNLGASSRKEAIEGRLREERKGVILSPWRDNVGGSYLHTCVPEWNLTKRSTCM